MLCVRSLNYTNPSNSYQIAVYDPARSPVTYTQISNGLTQYYMDGAYNGGYPRAVNITYTCSAAATTPYITSYDNQQVITPGISGNFVTLYQVAVTTAAVCGAPFQSRTCGTSVYNLTSLVGNVISYVDAAGVQYWVAPCGQVDVVEAAGCTGQVCQNGYILSYYTPSVTTWIPADNGVLAVTADGQSCGSYGPRVTTIRYTCNATATTPIISSVGEAPACKYTIVVQTSAVCGIVPNHGLGSTFASDSCGGGAYDLTQLAPTTDIVGVVDGGNFVFINPCGAVRNASCNNLGASVCYAYSPLVVPPSNVYDLARYTPVQSPIQYTILSNGVMTTYQDGDYCGAQVNIPRTVQISYVCSAAASTPTVTSYTSIGCQYNITVATSQVCGAAFNAPTASGYLCLMTYSTPGDIDYPWSIASALSFTYNPTLTTTAYGTAVQLLSGSGVRTYTNRFSIAFSTPFTLSTASSNLLYLGVPVPVDTTGLTLQLSSPVSLPGGSASAPTSTIRVYNPFGAITEAGAARVDTSGQVYLSNVPNFLNVTIGASDINSLAANNGACQAPISCPPHHPIHTHHHMSTLTAIPTMICRYWC